MVWWTVSGVLLLAVLVLAATMAALAWRARPLRREVGRLRVRAEQAQKLQTRALEVQERALDLAGRVEEVGAAAERLSARLPGARTGHHGGGPGAGTGHLGDRGPGAGTGHQGDREPGARGRGDGGPPGGFDGRVRSTGHR